MAMTMQKEHPSGLNPHILGDLFCDQPGIEMYGLGRDLVRGGENIMCIHIQSKGLQVHTCTYILFLSPVS